MQTLQKKYSLPDMSHSFKIDVIGNESGKNWTGEFVYHRPTLGDRSRIDQMRARLSGDLDSLSQEVDEFNQSISHLRFTLKKFPEWWVESNYGLDLYDGNVISEVYNRCLDYETKFLDRVNSGEPKDVEVKDEQASIVEDTADIV